MTALIGAVVTEVIGYAIYTIKATKENTKGGITYETAMRQGGITDDESKESNNWVWIELLAIVKTRAKEYI